MHPSLPACVGVVVIGRNEGERLVRALRQVPPGEAVVYVDSGSSDGSPDRARDQGHAVVELDPSVPFSAARARNAGFAHLLGRNPNMRYIQMIDGDCVLDSAWISTAASHFDRDSRAAVVFGRCREASPGTSIYNALCDLEWRAPLGEVTSSGGNAIFRVEPFATAGGFNAGLIAGEEPDLCHRLIEAGWKVVSLPQPMVEHDAAMSSFGQWWKRTGRAGFAYAQLVSIHGRRAQWGWRKAVRSILTWSLALPSLIATCAVWLWHRPSPGALFVLAVALGLYPLQVWRIARRERAQKLSRRLAWQHAAFLVLGKFPQLIGWLRFKLSAMTSTPQPIIEYKRR
jgi:GT2 family glycosyltransferase